MTTGCALLLKSMYGTKDAGQCFDVKSEETMKSLVFVVGVFTPCVYYHRERDATCFRHGDDFLCLAHV